VQRVPLSKYLKGVLYKCSITLHIALNNYLYASYHNYKGVAGIQKHFSSRKKVRLTKARERGKERGVERIDE